jgi:two-component system response regulator PilR (NtrC family)
MSEQALQILIADDEAIVRSTLGDYLRDCGHGVLEAADGTAALALADEHDVDLALVDVRMPGMDGLTLLDRLHVARPEIAVVIVTAHGNMETVIRALRAGAVDFLPKPVRFRELDAVLEKARQVRALKVDRRHLRETLAGVQTAVSRASSATMIGSSAASQQVREHIRRAVEARVDTILVSGETGTGKEVVARLIHESAGGASAPFIPVNCPAIPESLLESELFGHRKGAFTGATEHRAGYFELADGGTLFLDEIGDLSASAQAKLLRVLETRLVRRIGEAREKAVDVRVVAATNADLPERVKQGRFRADLYYRLNVFALELAPLRERRVDIVPLAEHFLAAFCQPRGWTPHGFSDEARQWLLEYDYPGNARELRNLVERGAILTRGAPITPEHLPARKARALSRPPEADEAAPAVGDAGSGSSDEDLRGRILRALEATRWNRRDAASTLGMPYSTLRFRMRRLGIS